MSLPREDYYWRYATKKFDPSRTISEKDFHELAEALRLAPSSFGLQPWKFVVVQAPALRRELVQYSWNQAQVAEASHLFVLCSLKTLDESYIKRFIAFTAQERGVPAAGLKTYEEMILSFIRSKTPEWISEWMKRQVYLALGFLMAAAARLRIDTCPMEGFDPVKYDELLGLAEKGLQSVVLCPVGYRAQDDKYAGAKKVRFSKEEVVMIR